MTQQFKNNTSTDAKKLEVYRREESGKLSPRLGFMGDFVKEIHVTNINQVIHFNQEEILQEIRSLPATLHRRNLLTKYQAIFDSYQSHSHHNDLQSLDQLIQLCTESAPEFEQGLLDELADTKIDPNLYVYQTQNFDKVEAAAKAYCTILALNFHAITIRHPSTAATEPVVLKRIKSAIKCLIDKLNNVLMPRNSLNNSLLLKSLLDSHSKKFPVYLSYIESHTNGAEGIKNLLLSTIRPNTYEPDLFLEYPKISRDYDKLADLLISLIERFQKLLKMRNDFKPEADETQQEPISDKKIECDQ